MIDQHIYTHKTKGGEYRIVVDGSMNDAIKCAGNMKEYDVILYKCIKTHQVYIRERLDFLSKMVVK